MKKSVIAVAVTAILASAVYAGGETGKINREYWTNHTGGIGKVKENVKKSVAPTGFDTLTSFEAISWDGSAKGANFADKYAQRIYGFVIPDKTGEYIFWIAADDAAELAVSTDEKPENAKTIAKTSTWTAPKQWTKSPSQKSKPVKLEAGKKYYIEAVMYEGAGGDNLAVAWSDAADAKAVPAVIPGKNLAPATKLVPAKK